MNDQTATPTVPALSIPPILPMLPILPTAPLAPTPPPAEVVAQTRADITAECTAMWRDLARTLNARIQAMGEDPRDSGHARAIATILSAVRRIRRIQNERISLYRLAHPGERIERTTLQANVHRAQRIRDTAKLARDHRRNSRSQEIEAKASRKAEDRKLTTESRVGASSFPVPIRPIGLIRPISPIRPILPIATIAPATKPKWDPAKIPLGTYLAQLEAFNNNHASPELPPPESQPPRRLPRAERRLMERAERRRLARLSRARPGPAP